jgi:hypothetical protein
MASTVSPHESGKKMSSDQIIRGFEGELSNMRLSDELRNNPKIT